jgi:hypothetical protein
MKALKKEFKKIMKKNIFLYEKNEYFKIEKLIKCKNGDSFFKKNNEIKKDKKENIDIKIDTLLEHYRSIFNRPLNVTQQVINEVHEEIKDIIHENFDLIEINITELKYAIDQCQSSNVSSIDGVFSKRIKNCDEKFIKYKLFFFFKFIFHYGVIPNGFNITHIIPIKKDKKSSINDIDNLRPISISNILAQIFERL